MQNRSRARWMSWLILASWLMLLTAGCSNQSSFEGEWHASEWAGPRQRAVDRVSMTLFHDHTFNVTVTNAQGRQMFRLLGVWEPVSDDHFTFRVSTPAGPQEGEGHLLDSRTLSITGTVLEARFDRAR